MRIEKAAIYQACLRRQQQLIDHFTDKIEELKKDIFSRENIPSQEDHQPAERIEILDSMEKELRFLQYEMSVLKSLDPEQISSVVEPGAVVVTDQRVFYVCVSIEEIEVEGHAVFGISTKAPLYREMAGKSAGQSFSFNKLVYQILDIY